MTRLLVFEIPNGGLNASLGSLLNPFEMSLHLEVGGMLVTCSNHPQVNDVARRAAPREDIAKRKERQVCLASVVCFRPRASEPLEEPLQEQQGEGCHVFGFLRVNKVLVAAQIQAL